MDSDSNSKDQDEESKKTAPSYTFDGDYRQATNFVADAEKADDKDTHEKIIDESVSAELQKMELEKSQPISMIVNKKKFRVRFLAVILFISALAFGGIYGTAILFNQGVIGGKNKRHIASGFSVEKLVCEMGSDSGDLLGAGNALELRSYVEANYTNNEFVDLLQTIEAKFENSSTAKIAMSNVRSSYVKRFKSFGVATEPFKSEYNQDDVSISVTHYANASMVDSTNAGVINISTNEHDVVIYDIDSVKKNYENDGYTCRIE